MVVLMILVAVQNGSNLSAVIVNQLKILNIVILVLVDQVGFLRTNFLII
ncbi:hypothetical protein ACI8B_590004 [Acinetobacter proteolyticus]|uniref:Uncharacterized protein n=1 Tax=Acinetobacter proteolyticus TaxID=1776741 RepID=A0A653KAY1_9GAMM|nr:hypothetical protein ACI8B_590004 [Acinetobacter proteolyticus]